MTYLQLVNAVLRRLRENEVTSVNDTPYSKLIGDLVNVVKREVEDSWEWSALRTTLSAVTTDGLFNYVLFGAGTRFKMLNVFNDTDNVVMENRSSNWFDQQFLLSNSTPGSPSYYTINGVSPFGDAQVDIYPIPDGTYDIRFNMVMPQDPLTADSERLLVPALIVIEGAISRAISERGDDGGIMEHEARYRSILSDHIAIESGYRLDEVTWSPC